MWYCRGMPCTYGCIRHKNMYNYILTMRLVSLLAFVWYKATEWWEWVCLRRTSRAACAWARAGRWRRCSGRRGPGRPTWRHRPPGARRALATSASSSTPTRCPPRCPLPSYNSSFIHFWKTRATIENVTYVPRSSTPRRREIFSRFLEVKMIDHCINEKRLHIRQPFQKQKHE